MIFARAESVCPVCLRVLPARKRSEPDGIYMDKTCPEHGNFSSLIWEGDLRSYLTWPVRNTAAEAPVDGKPRDRGCPYDCGLCREHRTKGCCVLLELTRRCNLHCPVCFASAGAGAESDLSLAEIETQYDYLMAHGGPFNIQLSGGEPTVRDDLPAIIRLGREKGFPFFQLNTNGLRLAREAGYAEELKAAGLNTVFLQFDGVTDAVFETLRGRPLLAEKEQAIVNCAAAGLGIVLVPVIAAGVNEDQVGAIQARDHPKNAAPAGGADGRSAPRLRLWRRRGGKPLLFLPCQLPAPERRELKAPQAQGGGRLLLCQLR